MKSRDGDTIATLHDGEFIGEFHHIEQQEGLAQNEIATVTVLYRQGTEVVEWQKEKMHQHLQATPAVRHSLEALWLREIKHKLDRMNEHEPYVAYVNVLRGIISDGIVSQEECRFMRQFQVNIKDNILRIYIAVIFHLYLLLLISI